MSPLPSSVFEVLAKRTNRQALGNQADTYLNVFLAFQIIAGHIILPFLVVTFTLTKAKRHVTLVNVCLTWIVSGVSSSLLFYVGMHRGPEPPVPLCLTQASLLYGVPPMTATAVLCLVYHMWKSIRQAMSNQERPYRLRFSSLETYALVVAPYIALLGFAIPSVFIGLNDLTKLSRNRRFFYCSIENDPFTNSLSIYTAVVLVVVMVFEVWIGVMLRRNWIAGKKLDIPLIGRILLFGLYILTALILSCLSIVAPRSPVPDVFAASVAGAVSIIFGSQPDVWKAWMFWRWNKAPPQRNASQRSVASAKSFDSHSSAPDVAIKHEAMV